MEVREITNLTITNRLQEEVLTIRYSRFNVANYLMHKERTVISASDFQVITDMIRNEWPEELVY